MVYVDAQNFAQKDIFFLRVVVRVAGNAAANVRVGTPISHGDVKVAIRAKVEVAAIVDGTDKAAILVNRLGNGHEELAAAGICEIGIAGINVITGNGHFRGLRRRVRHEKNAIFGIVGMEHKTKQTLLPVQRAHVSTDVQKRRR